MVFEMFGCNYLISLKNKYKVKNEIVNPKNQNCENLH